LVLKKEKILVWNLEKIKVKKIKMIISFNFDKEIVNKNFIKFNKVNIIILILILLKWMNNYIKKIIFLLNLI